MRATKILALIVFSILVLSSLSGLVEAGLFSNPQTSATTGAAVASPLRIAWAEKIAAPAPSSRNGHELVSIYDTDKILLFGGYGESADTWIYDVSDNLWTQMNPASAPSARANYGMAPIYGTDKVLLFGGLTPPAFNGQADAETWIYDLSENSWTKLNLQASPSARVSHAMASVYLDDKIALYGGTTGSSETWVYDLSDNAWTLMDGASPPSDKYSHAMATIHGHDKILLFGGTGGDDSTWIYDASDNIWSGAAAVTAPSARTSHTMATLFGTDKIVLFGGDSSGSLGDTWVYSYNDASWTQILLARSPSARSGHAMAANTLDDSAFMFGLSNTGDASWLFDLTSPCMESEAVCDGEDDDCNGLSDETFNIGEACSAGLGGCASAGTFICTADGTGTECNAVPGAPSVEVCDGVDNDCDGITDNGFDLSSDTDNCGTCGNVCINAMSAAESCINGACVLGACDTNYWDLDSDELNGCEYYCTQTNNGVETCDGLDNDCNGAHDETFDADSDFYSTCGTDTRTGTQVVADCDDNNKDINAGALEFLWDGVDNDCDGLVDAAIEILQPLAGARWTIGTIQTIEWLARNINNVELTYTTEPNAPCEGEPPQSNGLTCDVGPWQCIQEHGVINSAFSWTVPQIISDTVQIRVEGHDELHRVIASACSPAFTVGAACGNGELDAAEGEQCDDSNTVNGDGCSSACQTEAACTPDWQCDNWSACAPEGAQTRTCVDNNNCGTDEGRLPEEQPCTYVACTTDVDCTAPGNGVATCVGSTCVTNCNVGYELQNDVCVALPEEVCSNNVKDGSDECDGTDFGGRVCSDFISESAGTLACTPGCKVNTDACVVSTEQTFNSFEADAEITGVANGLFVEYSFKPKVRIVQPKIKIETLQAKPDGVLELQGAYKYATIETTNFDDGDIKDVRLQFVVEKSWLSDNNLDKTKVKLQRYENNGWVAYEGQVVSDGSSAIVYESATPGLSTFTVTAEGTSRPARRSEAPAAAPSGGGGFETRAIYKATPFKQVVAAPVVGDGKCESGENSQNACSDCGCGSPAYDCASNSCILKSELEAGALPEDRTPQNIISQSTKIHAQRQVILAAVLVAVGSIGYAFYRTYVKPKIELPDIAEAHDATEAGEIENAKSFIAHAMAEGYHATDLKEYLLEAGWPSNVVERAVKENSQDMLDLQGMAVEGSVEYPGDDTSYLKKYVAAGLAKGYTEAQIRAIVLANGWPEDVVDKVIK